MLIVEVPKNYAKIDIGTQNFENLHEVDQTDIINIALSYNLFLPLFLRR